VRRSLIIQLVLLSVVIGAISAAIAIFIPWLPELGSVQGGRIDDTYWLATIISLVIFTIVFSVSVYTLIKFRAKPDDYEDGKPIHGHTTLEVVWTVIPAVLVTAIAVYSAIVLVKNEDAPANTPAIEVEAEQFEWQFTYPELEVTTGVLFVEQGKTIELQMTAADVIHSFWVPQWRVKQDVVPGTVQKIIVTPTKLGRFPVICTELCGLGHSTMRTTAVVLSSSDYAKWLQTQQAAAEAGGATEGQQVFANAGCGACHTLAAAGATGEVGPSLDSVLPELTAEQVRESIVDPNAEIAEGYQPGVMPEDFGDQLSDEQLTALVDYLTSSAGQGS
jgi:cytochrome c oxidase subunit 2